MARKERKHAPEIEEYAASRKRFEAYVISEAQRAEKILREAGFDATASADHRTGDPIGPDFRIVVRL